MTALEKKFRGDVILEPKKDMLQPLHDYMRERLAMDGFWNGSQELAGLSQTRRRERIALIERQQMNLIRDLGIDSPLPQDPRVFELFFALSVLGLDRLSEEAHRFRFETAKVTAGQSSRIVRFEHLNKLEKCLADENHNPGEYTFDMWDEIEDSKDEDASTNLRYLLDQYDSNSIAARARRYLGIQQQKDEKPYEAIVVKDSAATTVDATGKKTSAFQRLVRMPTPCDGIKGFNPNSFLNSIVLSPEVYRDIIGSDEKRKAYAKKIVAHEYAHTQGDQAIGHLGFLFNEAMAVIASGTRNYLLEIFLINVLSNIMNHEGINFAKIFTASFKDPKLQTTYMQSITDILGPKALLTLFAICPQNYDFNYGITSIPHVNIENYGSDVVNLLFSEREKRSPGFTQSFTDKLDTARRTKLEEKAKAAGIILYK